VSAHDSTWRVELAFEGVLPSCSGIVPVMPQLEGGPISKRLSSSSGGRDRDSSESCPSRTEGTIVPILRTNIDAHSFTLSLLLELLTIFHIACSVARCLSYLASLLSFILSVMCNCLGH
jgi:hypothetical protein